MMNSKFIVWLTRLAKTSPLIFSIALLLMGLSYCGIIIAKQDSRIDRDAVAKQEITNKYEVRLDSMTNYYRLRDALQNEQMRSTLNIIIEDYKRQLEEQKNLNKSYNKLLK